MFAVQKDLFGRYLHLNIPSIGYVKLNFDGSSKSNPRQLKIEKADKNLICNGRRFSKPA